MTHFTAGADDYKRFRPTYPPALFERLAALSPSRERAWDCATGNGQAAVGLAAHFRSVVATDASAGQLAVATAHPAVEYREASAEDCGLDARSIDLVTVAQAIHWFDRDRFYAEVRRVAKPRGVLAVWCYSLVRIDPAIDRLIERLYFDVVGPYWPKEREHVEDRYRRLPFPFEELPAPSLSIERAWDLATLVGYLGTWSPVAIFIRERGRDPVSEIAEPLAEAWGEASRPRSVRWPLHFRIGRVV